MIPEKYKKLPARQLDPEGEFDKNGLGNHPAVIKLLAKVAPMVLGDKIVKGQINEGANAIEEELSGIRNNPAYMNEMHADHGRLVQRHNQLMQQRSMFKQR